MQSSNVLYMPQSAVKKAALSKVDGGKHSLGTGILYELPFQLADPLAITGNTTKHEEVGDSSIVVWTDWMTATGDSVIVPIRIGVTGNVGVYNNVNTVFDAYDPNYVADLLRDGNVLYTRNNENIQELLSQRREVPKVNRSSDVSNDSIYGFRENVKGNSSHERFRNQTAAMQTTQNDTQAYAGTEEVSPRYNWTADNHNEGNAAGVVSLSEIVEDIKNQFGVAVNQGKLAGAGALGEFHNHSEGIRLRTANEVAILAHELGHFLDKQFGIRRLPSVQTAIDIFTASTPDLAAQYKGTEIYGEAVAEFVRRYMTDRTAAQQDYGMFFDDFLGALSPKARQSLDAIGNKVNAYGGGAVQHERRNDKRVVPPCGGSCRSVRQRDRTRQPIRRISAREAARRKRSGGGVCRR